MTAILTPKIFSSLLLLTHVASTSAQVIGEELPPIPGLDTEAAGSEWIPASSLEGQQVGQEENATQLLTELSRWLGIDLLRNAHKDLEDLEAAIKPIFDAVPLNEYGKLGHTAARYVLHRLFVSRHGWLIRGLEPDGENFNASSPLAALKGKLPDHVSGVFEKRLGGSGLNLQEVALFAAVLENLIHKETADKIRNVYRLYDVEEDIVLDEIDATAFVDIYMAAYVLGLDLNKENASVVMRSFSIIDRAYPNWPETQKFTRTIVEDFKKETWTLDDIVLLALRIGEGYGRFQNKECQTMKQSLMKLEGAEKGCIPMSNFYKAMLTTGQWQFSESPDYLRQLGALDDSNPQALKVIMPNYVNSMTNCVASSIWYSICCIDECEDLLGHIERRVQAPDAAVDELIAIVSELPSSTVPANRELSKSQTRQLNRIAWHNGGRVPLHGRLFMQWLHMVFPRECAYPHKSGTTRPQNASAYEKLNGADATFAPVEVMRSFMNASSTPQPSEKDGQCGQWQDEEEYLIPRPTHLPHLSHLETDTYTWAANSCVALACALAAMLVTLMSYLKTMKAAARRVLPPPEDHSKFVLV